MHTKEKHLAIKYSWMLPFYYVPNNNRRPACLWNGADTDGSPGVPRPEYRTLAPGLSPLYRPKFPPTPKTDGMGHHNQGN
jgi:hypothetical protein